MGLQRKRRRRRRLPLILMAWKLLRMKANNLQPQLRRQNQSKRRKKKRRLSLKKRFVTYEQATMPIIKHFEAQNLVKKLDASKSPDEVYAEVEKILSAF